MTKNYTLMLRGVVVLSLLITLNLQAQTLPTAQTLPYSQNFSGLVHGSTTYPAGWQGDSIGSASSGSFRLTAASADRAMIATSNASINTGGVHNYSGKIGILSTGSVDGALRLVINTTGVNRVLVNFNIMTIRNPHNGGANTRINGVDLQYRIGTTGNFVSVTNLANGTYQNNTTNQTTAVTSPQNQMARSLTLPTACNNQPLVQLRWVQRDISGAGERPSFAIDDVAICATTGITTPTISITGTTSACTGQPSIYQATVTNGGTTPNYSWRKNGVSTGSPSVSGAELAGLALNDQISCVLTSNANCITTLTATSNIITIANAGAPPAISSANILHACPGQSNASIDITPSGGTAPYTTCWDTTNTANGPMFAVTLGTKICPANPYCGMGSLGNSASFRVDGVDAKNLSVLRGLTYTFNILAGHPFHISTDSVGASSVGILRTGVTPSTPISSGTYTFKPNDTHKDTVYYPCSSHDFMGYKIFRQTGYCVEDLTNLHTGTYSVVVTDAIGCTASASYLINQSGGPVSATLASSTNASCFGAADGNINLTPSGGSAPYTATGTGPTFMVISQVKNHSHPVFGTGSANGYTIDNVQGKELTLMRGITYSFSVLAPGHPFFISSSSVGGPGNLGSEITNGVTGSMTTNGTLTFTPNNTHPNLLYYQCGAHNNMGWKINIVDQLPNADLGNCMAGNYSLFVKNANGCTSSSPVNVTITQPSANTFYYDGDSDLFGRDNESALACNAPPSFVTVNGDCDDANPSVNPGAIEICNGIDDNCDLSIDDNTIFINLLSTTPADCGSNNGSIDIDVTGGTGPYTICWDTSNIANGPAMMVSEGAMTANNPYFGQGVGLTYYTNGVEAKELTLTKGITYEFNVFSPGHPWHISTDFIGGNTSGLVVNGQNGAPTDNGMVTFTPDSTHPSLLHYVCASHDYMGYNINISDGYCIEDPVDLRAGTYAVVVTDANGCGSTATFTVSEVSIAVNLNSFIDASCGVSNGAIDISVSGGTEPYTICWDTVNTANGASFGVMVGAVTPANPYFGFSPPAAYYIDGVEAKELTLTRGITYDFNVFSPGHPWHISTDFVGGSNAGIVTDGQSGAPNDNGSVTFTPNINHPSLLGYVCENHGYMGYNINITDGYCIEDLTNLPAGIYNVAVTDANGCTGSATYTINQTGSPVDVTLTGQSDVSCFGYADGMIDLEPSSGTAPYTAAGDGPTFMVISQPKNHSHPQFNMGSANGYTIDGVQGKELTLMRGITYYFSVFVPGHPFFISTSDIGGPGNLGSEVTDGVTNSMTVNGTLTFTPNINHPNLLYYQCAAHNRMGWKINIVDQLPDADLGNCMAGNYSLYAVDADGCSSINPVNVFISEPAASTFYYDGDNDTFGWDNESALSCLAPPGFVDKTGDCNDTDPLINPNASEICNNGIDEDCDFQVDDSCEITLNVKVFIEGFYSGGSMTSPLLNSGETTDPLLCDSITINLHESVSPHNLLDTRTVPLSINGDATAEFPSSFNATSVYIALKLRNSIETWSKLPVPLGSTTFFDFTVPE